MTSRSAVIATDNRGRGGEIALAGAVAFSVAWEAFLWIGPLEGRPGGASLPALLPSSLVVGAALWWGRRQPERIRPLVALGLVAVQALGFLAVHALTHWGLDAELRQLYPALGSALRASHRLPSGPWPPLAVVVFAVADRIGPIAVALPLLTLPVLLAAVWKLGTRTADGGWWLAAVGLWPALTVIWELRFEPLPAALAALGILVAGRRPGAGGALLGIGFMVKWYPGLALPPLVVAALRRRDRRAVVRLLVGAAVPVLVVTAVAAANGQWSALADPYRFQGGRGVTGESLPFLLLWVAGRATAPTLAWEPAGSVPSWVTPAGVAVQVIALVVLTWLAWRRPERATALAALAPALLLVCNRVFSSQFVLPVVLLLVVAAQQVGDARVRSTIVAAIGMATVASAAVHPGGANGWLALQWAVFLALGVALTTTVLAVVSRSPTRDVSRK